MKTISIQQPWASLLAEGTNTIEIRSGNNNYRGDILIRASRNAFPWIGDNGKKIKLPTECLFFVGELIDVRPMEQKDAVEAMREFNIIKYSWLIKRKYFVENIPCAGRLTLYDTPDDLIKPLTDEEAYARFPQLKHRSTHPFRATVREYHIDCYAKPYEAITKHYEVNHKTQPKTDEEAIARDLVRVIRDWKEVEIINPKMGEIEICTLSQSDNPPAFHVFHRQLGYIGGARPSPDNNTQITQEEIASSINQGRVWRRIDDLPLRGGDEASGMEEQLKNFACCYKILQMVGVLHSRGYQRLRVFPYVREMWWRCELAPAELFDPAKGACFESKPEYDEIGLVARVSSAGGSHPFKWRQDISPIPVERLADLFLLSFPAIARDSQGSDRAYAEWYQEMLMHTSPLILPIAYYQDAYETEVYKTLRLGALVGEDGEDETMPLPPCYSPETTANLSCDGRDKLTPQPRDNLFG